MPRSERVRSELRRAFLRFCASAVPESDNTPLALSEGSKLPWTLRTLGPRATTSGERADGAHIV